MRRERGFTLLEVIVAFAILTLSLAAVYEVYAASARRSAHLADRTPAIALAESLLAEGTVAPLNASAERSGAVGAYRWTLRTTPVDPEVKSSLPVVSVKVDVSWGSALYPQHLVLTQLAFARRVENPT
jgi:general secretion pathway protein I